MQKAIIENVKTIIYALLIAGLFRTLLFQPFFIPSGSMKDTLLVGDFMFVNKYAYGYSSHSCPWSLCPFPGRIFFSEPERGDIIVFKHPVNRQDYIKRLIGLPGDKIQMADGILQINGKPVPKVPNGTFNEEYAPQGAARGMPRCVNRPTPNEYCIKDRYVETLPNGTSHSVLDITKNGFLDNTPIYTVPEGEYFFVGDNRDNSQDSRVAQAFGGVGTVSYENLIGRADRVIFSSAGRRLIYFWTWRADRFFKALE